VVLHDYALYKSTFTLLYFTKSMLYKYTYTQHFKHYTTVGMSCLQGLQITTAQ